MKQMQKMKPATSITPPTTKLQKISNVAKRVSSATLMISGFLLIIWMGPLALMILGFAIEVACFSELLKVGYNNNKVPPSLPYFRRLCWYFFIATNYFIFIENVAPHFQDFVKKFSYLQIIIRYHRFISFCVYFIGIVLFVLSLVRKHDLKQFKILAWIHTSLLIIVLQFSFFFESLFEGLIWVILPISLVTLNDIWAFVFGRLWGRTPLIKLSPKKTWEGFIGGVVGTFISGYMISNPMCAFNYFVCPVEYHETGNGIRMNMGCTPSYLFTPSTYSLGIFSLNFYPFTYHFLSLAAFASIIAPFGGFCASGFKRAFKIKDFGNFIPGHGGIMDRFDCQFLMSTFVHVYIFTFVRNPSVDWIFEKILYLDEDRQVEFFHMLRDALQTNSTDVN